MRAGVLDYSSEYGAYSENKPVEKRALNYVMP